MQFVKGTLLHKKEFKTKKGELIPVISILDHNKTFSQVLDITDFDHHASGVGMGEDVFVPVKVKAVVSEKGNPYLNYVTADVIKACSSGSGDDSKDIPF